MRRSIVNLNYRFGRNQAFKNIEMTSVRAMQMLIACITSLIFLSACTSVPPRYYDTQREKVHLVNMPHRPTMEVPYGVETTGEGVMSGVGKGMGACLGAGAQSGDGYGLLLSIVLMPVCGIVGGIHGAATAEDEKAAKKEGVKLVDWINGEQIQMSFTKALIDYARRQDIEHEVINPTDYAKALQSEQPMMEMLVKEVAVKRLKKGDTPEHDLICIRLSFAGQFTQANRKTPLDFTTNVGCHTVEQWHHHGKEQLQAQIESKIESLAEYLIDEYLLVYHPTVDDHHPALRKRYAIISERYPPYVLAALKPGMFVPVEESGASLYDSGRVHSRTHLEIPIVTDDHPKLVWESFPMPWDEAIHDERMVDDVRYELKVYEADFRKGERLFESSRYQVKQMVYKKDNLVAAQVTIDHDLEPCRTYFWTVRAKFKLKGSARVTEWSGMYSHISSPWIRRDLDRTYNSFYPMFTLSPEGMNCQ